jgi:hypothetical protein
MWERLAPDEIDAVLEVGYLSIASDGRLMDEEVEAFIRSMLRLYGPTLTPDRVRGMLEGYADRLEEGPTCLGARCTRVDELAGRLRRPEVRDLAYALSYVLAMSDLETNDEEFGFDQTLRRALRLDDEAAEALVDEVMARVLEPR